MPVEGECAVEARSRGGKMRCVKMCDFGKDVELSKELSKMENIDLKMSFIY